MARWANSIHDFLRKDAYIVLAFALAARKKIQRHCYLSGHRANENPPLLATEDWSLCLDRWFYARPTPKYSKPSAFMRGPSSRFLVSTTTGLRMMRRMRSKSSVRNSGQPVPSTRASAPSATEYAESQ